MHGSADTICIVDIHGPVYGWWRADNKGPAGAEKEAMACGAWVVAALRPFYVYRKADTGDILSGVEQHLLS